MPESTALTTPPAADHPAPRLQRASGQLRITAKPSGTETVLDDLRQAGCLKARFPRPLTPGWLDAVMLNTGGGVAGGDRLDVSVTTGASTQVTITAQAAERVYRALDEPSHIRTHLTAQQDSTLEWLPQETILFDRFSLDRRLDIHLHPTARFLGVETLVFGRAAMGETVNEGWLRDLVLIRRGETLLLHDAIRLAGPIHDTLARSAIAGGASVIATLLLVAPDAEAHLTQVREALSATEAGASAWNGLLIARVLGRDSAQVRRAVIAALTVLRRSRPLPRVWLC